MRILFLSPAEPFYLPAFYRHLFEDMPPVHQARVTIVPPVYKNSTRLGLAVRYARTFGLKEALVLTSRAVHYKAMDLLARNNGNRFYSLPAVLRKYRVPYSYEPDINSTDFLKKLRDWNTELIISISCPQIFKKELIGLPPKGCLNLHGSPLPDYRGIMPSFWMLANDEKEAGTTLFFVNEEIDAGDVLIQKRFPVLSEDTLDSLIANSKRIGAEMVLEGIELIEKGNPETWSLDLSKGRYFGWPKREDVERFLGHGRRFRKKTGAGPGALN